jgi:hypothetical protein
MKARNLSVCGLILSDDGHKPVICPTRQVSKKIDSGHAADFSMTALCRRFPSLNILCTHKSDLAAQS